MLGKPISNVKGSTFPTIAINIEVGVLDSLNETIVVHILLTTDNTETMTVLVVGDDVILAVGVGNRRRINSTVAQHFTLRVYNGMAISEGNGLCIYLIAII